MTGAAKRPGGTGVSPVQAFKVTRRNLPHWQEPGRVYFVTWRCQDGQTLSSQERSVTLEAIKHWEGRRWTVYAAVVMADHVHALVQPLPHPEGGFFDLSMILHSVKSFSVHQINRLRGTEGPLWLDESFDRIVRNEVEFLEKWQYIINNPLKKELVQNPEEYPWLYMKND